MRKRILSLLLCLIMVVGMLPTTAFAIWGVDGYYECIFCGAVYYGDDVDDSIYEESDYCCGIDGNQDCWLENHCYECGEYVDRSVKNDCCNWCEDCIKDQGTHCSECDECYLSDEDQLCGECHRCDTCAGGICEDCGLCDDCAESGDNTHCIFCGACATSADWHDDTHHCLDCCVFCEQCEGVDTCLAENEEKEFCDECGLCMDCCMENREAFGCDLFCVESSEFEEHFCEECGECWCNTYQCGYCGLCAECCEANSDCTEHMCVEDSDYDDHFCPECGDCFHEAEQCDYCGLCEDCCQKALEEVKVASCCDAFSCVEQDGFAKHMAEYHSEKGYTHVHRFAKGWSMDETYHWHACLSCDEGKNATGSGKAGHTADPDTGICTVCGYKNGETMYFITQPEDAHVQVSESHYYGSYYWANPGPTNYWKNRTFFRVKAFSKDPLYYRWYQVKDGVATPLDNNTTDKGELYVSGATTPTLTISVSTDCCTSNYSYYCEITDGKGTTTPVKSSQAKMIASHRYSLAAYDKTTESGSIWLKTYYGGEEGWLNRAQTSTGHKWYCCGTGHGDTPVTLNKKAKSHNFVFQGTAQGAFTKDALLANNCITFNKYRCTDCSYVKYVAQHTCDMEAKAYGESHEDVATKHQLVCKTAGCDKTGSALHEWAYVTEDGGYFPRQNPDDSNNGKVIRRCLACGYLDTNFIWKTAAVTKDPTTGETTVGAKTELSWNTSNILVDVENGTANRPLVNPGDTVVLTPTLDGEHKFTGWKVNYHYWDAETNREINKSLTIKSSAYTVDSNGIWSYTIPSNFFDNYPGGGELFFHGQYDMSGACTHEGCGTTLVGYKAAVCIYDGYTGDTVCAACGGLVKEGSVTPGGTAHTGTLIPIEGSEKVDATCTKDGHEADTRCSACNHVVSGKVIPKTGHTRVVEGKTDATCTEKGYTGDTVCSTCKKALANGHEIAATGHKWGNPTESKHGKLTVITYTCQNKGCEATKSKLQRGDILRGDYINSINLTMSGYALGKTAGDVKVKPDTDTAEKLTAKLTGIYSARPFISDGKENINAKLSDDDEIEAAKTYYALVQLTANEGLTFNPDMSTKQVTLYKTRRAAELRVVEDPVTGEKYYFAVFSLKPLHETNVSVESVALTVTAPVTDATAAEATTEDATYTIANTSWVDGDGNDLAIGGTFAVGKVYTVKVELEAAGDNVFTARTTYTINGATATVVTLGEEYVTLTYTFPATEKSKEDTPIVPAPVEPVKPVEPAEPTKPETPTFPDVLTGSWYEDAVTWAVGEGITTGTTDGLFDPDGLCTRAQAVTFLWRAAGCPTPKSTKMPFTDVVSGSYYDNAVLWAVENGITKGTSNTTFSPDLKCSRTQIVTFLWRSQKSPVISAANPFTDVKADAYYTNAVLWAAANDITSGTSATTFSPDLDCTRAQIVTFLYRCMK